MNNAKPGMLFLLNLVGAIPTPLQLLRVYKKTNLPTGNNIAMQSEARKLAYALLDSNVGLSGAEKRNYKLTSRVLFKIMTQLHVMGIRFINWGSYQQKLNLRYRARSRLVINRLTG